jgi:hypothetical protein
MDTESVSGPVPHHNKNNRLFNIGTVKLFKQIRLNRIGLSMLPSHKLQAFLVFLGGLNLKVSQNLSQWQEVRLLWEEVTNQDFGTYMYAYIEN